MPRKEKKIWYKILQTEGNGERQKRQTNSTGGEVILPA
jgi:hypothetical protein